MKTNGKPVVSLPLTLASSLIFLGLSLVSREARADDLIVPRAARQWEFQMDGRAEPITTGKRYSLWNTRIKHYVKYGKREYGINLVWEKTVAPNNIRIERQRKDPKTGADRPPQLTFGESMAIYVDGGGYLIYHEREYGINLEFVGGPSAPRDWDEAPHPEIYQWRLLGTGAIKDTVKTKQSVALFNTKLKDYVIYAEREYGINLRWYQDTVKH